jgi:hypothetical protein
LYPVIGALNLYVFPVNVYSNLVLSIDYWFASKYKNNYTDLTDIKHKHIVLI